MIKMQKIKPLCFCAGLALLSVISSCGPIVKLEDDTPPPTLYSIQAHMDGELAEGGPVIYLGAPLLPGETGGIRIAVRTGDFQISHLRNGRWTEPFQVMLHRYLVTSLGSSLQAQFVGAGALDIHAQCRLTLSFQRFDYSAGDREVAASAIARLSSLERGEMLASKTFQSSVPVAADESQAIVAGFDQMARKVSDELAGWLTPHLPSCGSGAPYPKMTK